MKKGISLVIFIVGILTILCGAAATTLVLFHSAPVLAGGKQILGQKIPYKKKSSGVSGAFLFVQSLLLQPEI